MSRAKVAADRAEARQRQKHRHGIPAIPDPGQRARQVRKSARKEEQP